MLHPRLPEVGADGAVNLEVNSFDFMVCSPVSQNSACNEPRSIIVIRHLHSRKFSQRENDITFCVGVYSSEVDLLLDSVLANSKTPNW